MEKKKEDKDFITASRTTLFCRSTEGGGDDIVTLSDDRGRLRVLPEQGILSLRNLALHLIWGKECGGDIQVLMHDIYQCIHIQLDFQKNFFC